MDFSIKGSAAADLNFELFVKVGFVPATSTGPSGELRWSFTECHLAEQGMFVAWRPR
jgi:hypothetical protein